MAERKHLISSRQLMVLIIGGQLGIGMVSIPYELAKEVGHDVWIPTLIAGILTIAASMVLVLLLDRYKNKSIYEINKLLFGKFIGMIMNYIFILYFLYQATFTLRAFVETIHTNVLKMTPPIVLTVLVLISTVYVAWYGFKVTCRFSSVIFITIAFIFLLYIINFQYVRAVFLMPVGQTLATPAMARGVFISIFEYFSFELTAVVYPYIEDKKNTMKFVIAASTFSLIFYLLTAVVLTGYFGENMLSHIIFPIYGLASSYKAPTLERIDLYFLAVWLPAMGVSLKAYFTTTYYSIVKLFKLSKPTIVLVVFVIGSVALSFIPKDVQSLYPLERILTVFGIAVAYIYPAICYGFSFINKKGISRK